MEVRITFKDETEILAEQNGDSFILDEPVTFPEDLSEVRVENEQGEKTLHNVTVTECASVDGRYWFALIEEGPQERVIRELRAENEILEGAIAELAEIIGGGD